MKSIALILGLCTAASIGCGPSQEEMRQRDNEQVKFVLTNKYLVGASDALAKLVAYERQQAATLYSIANRPITKAKRELALMAAAWECRIMASDSQNARPHGSLSLVLQSIKRAKRFGASSDEILSLANVDPEDLLLAIENNDEVEPDDPVLLTFVGDIWDFQKNQSHQLLAPQGGTRAKH